MEKCVTEINCNGVIQMTGFPNSCSQGSVQLEDDLHNANNCGDNPHTQKKENFHSCNYSQRNGDSENSPQEAVSDSFVPLVSEDSMVCQPTSNEEQSFNEQEINHLQESIRTEIPSEDENENNSPSDNKGERGMLRKVRVGEVQILSKTLCALGEGSRVWMTDGDAVHVALIGCCACCL